MDEILDRISANYNINNLFSLGLFSRFENVKRIYLDYIPLKGIIRFKYLLNKLELELSDILLNKDFYVCINICDDKKRNIIHKKTFKELLNIGVEIPDDFKMFSEFDENEEWYNNIIFYKENKEKLINYIWGVLATDLGVKPFFANMSKYIFFISGDGNTLISLYDDRGYDVMSLVCDE